MTSSEEASYRQVVEKLKKTYCALDDEHRDENGTLDEAYFRQVFAESHSPNAMRRTTAKITGPHAPAKKEETYEEIVERTLVLARDPTCRLKLMRYKRTGPNSFHLYLRFTREEGEIEALGQVIYDPETCVIDRFDMERLLVEVPPGQRPTTTVDTGDDPDSSSSSSAAATGKKRGGRHRVPVQELPSVMNGRILGAGTPMTPTQLEEGETLQIHMHHQKGHLESFLKTMWGITTKTKGDAGSSPNDDSHQHHQEESWKLTTTTEQNAMTTTPYANGAYLVKHYHSKIKSAGPVLRAVLPTRTAPCWILCDDRHRPCVICQPAAKKKHSFDILAPRPLIHEAGDYAPHHTFKLTTAAAADASKATQEDDKNSHGKESDARVFYPWFRIIRQDFSNDQPLYFLLMLTELLQRDDDSALLFEPLYTVMPGGGGGATGKQENDDGSSTSSSVTITDYYSGAPVGMVVENEKHNKKPREKEEKDGGTTLRVEVTPGIDPALMLCIAAGLHDMRVVVSKKK